MAREILQVIGSGEPGGGTTAVLTLAGMLHKAGEAVAIVSQRDSYLLQEAARLGIPTHGLDFASRGKAMLAFTELARLFRRVQPEIVHAHGSRAGLPVSLACRFLAGSRPWRFVYTVHGFHFLAKPAGAFHLARAVERLCIAEADWTNFVSFGDRAIAQRQGLLHRPGSSSVIPNAVLVGDLAAEPERVHDLVFVGRLTPQKNPLILADIVAALGPLRPVLQVVGGGELEGALKERVRSLGLEDRFNFQGPRDRTSTLGILARSRLLVLPSLWEGHPITLIEAMHLGVPVVASKVSGTEEIVREGVTGRLVPPRDVAAYAQAIGDLLRDPQQARALGDNARREAALHFSPERMLAANLTVYRPPGSSPSGTAAAGPRRTNDARRA